jgi:hypothetical protein
MIVPLHDPCDLARLRELCRTEPLAKQRDRYRVALLTKIGSVDRASELEREDIARVKGEPNNLRFMAAGVHTARGRAMARPRVLCT